MSRGVVFLSWDAAVAQERPRLPERTLRWSEEPAWSAGAERREGRTHAVVWAKWCGGVAGRRGRSSTNPPEATHAQQGPCGSLQTPLRPAGSPAPHRSMLLGLAPTEDPTFKHNCTQSSPSGAAHAPGLLMRRDAALYPSLCFCVQVDRPARGVARQARLSGGHLAVPSSRLLSAIRA